MNEIEALHFVKKSLIQKTEKILSLENLVTNLKKEIADWKHVCKQQQADITQLKHEVETCKQSERSAKPRGTEEKERENERHAEPIGAEEKEREKEFAATDKENESSQATGIKLEFGENDVLPLGIKQEVIETEDDLVSDVDVESHAQRLLEHSYSRKRKREETSHACCICGRKFPTPSNLERHLRIHAGEKPFECEVPGCGFSCTQENGMRRHKAYVHSRHRPHECTECGFSCVERSVLRRHQASHEDLRRHYCPAPDCAYSAVESNTIRRHVARLHKSLALPTSPTSEPPLVSPPEPGQDEDNT